MPVATYTTDLQLITDAESGTFVEIGTWTRGTLSTGYEADYYIQGNACKSSTVKDGLNSIALVVSSFTIPDPGAVFFWQVLFAPNSMDTFDNGGQRCVIGTDISNFSWWNSGGSNRYPNNSYGGWENIAISPTVTPDGTAGTPSTNTLVGLGVYLPVTYPSKGAPFGFDACRYGRGQLRAEYGTPTGPANFTDMAYENDTGPNRWGLCSLQGGSFIQKGLLSIGYTGACYFEDSNKSIIIADTPRATGPFNKWEINETGTVFRLTNCSVAALGTASPGDFIMVDNATGVYFDACTFKDMGTFTFQSNGTILGSTFLRCDSVTQGGALFTSCIFDTPNINSTGVAYLDCDDADNIANCQFKSNGTGHAIELAPTGAGPLSFNFSGNLFSSYATGDGDTGNECILVNPDNTGCDITFNVIGGGDTPSIREHPDYAGTFTLVIAPVTLGIIVNSHTGAPMAGARVFVTVANGANFPYNVSVGINSTGDVCTVTHTGHGLSSNDEIMIRKANLGLFNGAKTITVSGPNQYTYPVTGPAGAVTGSPEATFILINNVSDASGYASDTRSYNNDQPIGGWARKSTNLPYYKQAPINGTIDKDSGVTISVQFVLDE